MAHYVGIDASLETVNICIVDDEGTVCLERKIEADQRRLLNRPEFVGDHQLK